MFFLALGLDLGVVFGFRMFQGSIKSFKAQYFDNSTK